MQFKQLGRQRETEVACFTRFDQVDQLIEAREADPDLGCHGSHDGAVFSASHQPRGFLPPVWGVKIELVYFEAVAKAAHSRAS